MRLNVSSCVVLSLLLMLGSAPSSLAKKRLEDTQATTGSKRIGFAARQWLVVDLDVQGVTVDRLKLHPPGRVRGLFTKHDEANRAKIAVTNRTDRRIQPSVAIAVFDEEGYLLAAANTGPSLTSLRPGVTSEMDLHFGGVFRHLEDGAFIYLSLEY
ncbi:MAG: hypothetical protein AAF533_30635 [Acidobacteriota bacterium]